ncbi:MAG: VCBS repeat-containing protein [Chlorobi bacterium]|nr:VCBS repeat-containing protein [Chlorobiota bacterium]
MTNSLTTQYQLRRWSLWCITMVAFCCNQLNAQQGSLFTFLPPDETGVTFANPVVETQDYNINVFIYAYNGAGVAAGDVNGDALPDLFFGSSQGSCKLYLNRGNFRFEDVTQSAGVADSTGVHFGVSMIDIDGDQDLDVYLCKEFEPNKLFINDGNGNFTEHAKEFGLDWKGFSMQSAFFDYDRDGDLDMYLGINGRGSNNPQALLSSSGYNNTSSDYLFRGQPDQLFKNNGNQTFTNVTKEAGILDNGFCQSVSIGDLNNDGWPDIYLANDFEIRDILYLNNHDGTFRNASRQALRHTSQASMGTDIADFNNDGLLDIISLDMLPEDHKRRMSHIGVGPIYSPTYDSTQMTRNVLQLNLGNGSFTDIGQLAGIAETDWSWAALLEDLDNDGNKDLFITNGYKRDVSNLDVTFNMQRTRMDPVTMYRSIPTTRLQNYVFRNNGDLTFSKYNNQWGITQVINSNGAVVCDLDRDGDLDIVTNNIDSVAFLYRNNAEQFSIGRYLRVALRGNAPNTEGIGTRIELWAGGNHQLREVYRNRGYLSSVEPIAHFGIAAATVVDSLRITWPDGTIQQLKNVQPNQTLTLSQADATMPSTAAKPSVIPPLFTPTTDNALKFVHKENGEYDDFKRERLIPRRFSKSGPGIASGDANGDDIDDLFIGGAKGIDGKIFLQQPDGTFQQTKQNSIAADSASEDMGALFFDADNDGDNDLYVVSGGNEFEANDQRLQDRLYLNDGKGNFTRSASSLPRMLTSGSCVVAADYDMDGDFDLFVGGRVVPGAYPTAPRSYLLRNDKGKFTDVTATVAPGLDTAGMVSGAIWTDADNDNAVDLFIVGEWMSPRLFRNIKGKFQDITSTTGLDSATGWWNSIIAGDFDNDGDMDYVAGNLGLNTNSRHHASHQFPVRLYANDFDDNGSLDLIMSYYYQGTEYPMRDRMTMSGQMPPYIRRKYPTFSAYAAASLSSMFAKEKLDSAQQFFATTFSTSYIENLGNGKFAIRPLPTMAQVSPTLGMVAEDFTGDGNLDLLLVGNFHGADQEVILYDAGQGLLLRGNGKGDFQPETVAESGIFAPNDTRGVISARKAESNTMYAVVVNNNGPAQLLQRQFATSEGKLWSVDKSLNYTHLLVKFSDGSQRRYECSFGSGYLSQCSGAIFVPSTATEAVIFRGSKLLKTITFNGKSGINGKETTQ